MRIFPNHWSDYFVVFAAIVALHFALRELRVPRRVARFALVTGGGLLMAGLMLRSLTFAAMLPVRLAEVLRMSSFLTLILVIGSAAVAVILRLFPRPEAHHSPERRKVLLAARTAILASPAVATGYGVFIQRDNFRLREVDVPIRGLHKDLDGLRMVQLSDIHLSPFLSEREFARAVDMANATNADLALVTGDLITSSKDPLDACIAQLARLRTPGGVLGCLGNHEVYTRSEEYIEREAGRRGMRFLRDASEVLTFRGQPLNFYGIDYQSLNSTYLAGAGKHVKDGMPNILLSHSPDVFRKSPEKGFDLTISGHTHGGQITMEVLRQNVSIARFYTPWVYGLYRNGDSSIYVTRGIGTVGVPARLGAPPEVALIRLCAI